MSRLIVKDGVIVRENTGEPAFMKDYRSETGPSPELRYIEEKAAERELVAALRKIETRFLTFDQQHPSFCTNEAARQLLAEIQADVHGALAKVKVAV